MGVPDLGTWVCVVASDKLPRRWSLCSLEICLMLSTSTMILLTGRRDFGQLLARTQKNLHPQFDRRFRAAAFTSIVQRKL